MNTSLEDDELKILRENIDTLTDDIKYQGDEVVHLREDLGILFDLVNAMSAHVVKLDDTVTRLTLENAKQANQLKNHERAWDRIDKDVQLFGNKVVGYGLDKENKND